MNLETKITIYNFTPSGFYVDPLLPCQFRQNLNPEKYKDYIEMKADIMMMEG